MKIYCFKILLIFATIACFMGFQPSDTFADSHASEETTDVKNGKFGIGFHTDLPLNGISAKYWTPTGIGFQGLIFRAGFSVPSEDISASLSTLGGRFLYTVQEKVRSRFYLGGGANYTLMNVGDSEVDVNNVGLGLEGFGGVEYSFSEHPNLGFAFEIGIKFIRLNSDEFEDDALDLHFTTSGTVGIHYYF